MQLEVIDPGHARVVVGGDIPAGKGLNLPSSRLDLPSLGDRDREALRLGVALGVDFVGVSFVRRAADLDEARASGVPVVAKIEKGEAVDRLPEIVAAADAIMVARGDLGVEIPIERVPVVQKRCIALANAAAKPVITATQMLRSMVDSPLPTRAEASDVANAVLDGTDAVMLSEETAVGRHPVEAVRMMRRILREAETLPVARRAEPAPELRAQIAAAACTLAARLGAAAIVVPTRSGATACRVAACRPGVPIVALTPDEAGCRRLSLVWGVTALALPWAEGRQPTVEQFREPLRATGLLPAGAAIVVCAAWPGSPPGATNLVHVTTA
jgi:pyruvate kinase